MCFTLATKSRQSEDVWKLFMKSKKINSSLFSFSDVFARDLENEEEGEGEDIDDVAVGGGDKVIDGAGAFISGVEKDITRKQYF